MNVWGIRWAIFVVTVRAESSGRFAEKFVVTAIAGRGVVNIATYTIVMGHVMRLTHNYYNNIYSN